MQNIKVAYHCCCNNRPLKIILWFIIVGILWFGGAYGVSQLFDISYSSGIAWVFFVMTSVPSLLKSIDYLYQYSQSNDFQYLEYFAFISPWTPACIAGYFSFRAACPDCNPIFMMITSGVSVHLIIILLFGAVFNLIMYIKRQCQSSALQLQRLEPMSVEI
jgi:hypothetical protein